MEWGPQFSGDIRKAPHPTQKIHILGDLAKRLPIQKFWVSLLLLWLIQIAGLYVIAYQCERKVLCKYA